MILCVVLTSCAFFAFLRFTWKDAIRREVAAKRLFDVTAVVLSIVEGTPMAI